MEQLEQVNRRLELDINERQRTEDKLREAELRYHTLFEHFAGRRSRSLIRRTTRPLEFNAAAHRQLGYSREEFAQLSLADIDVTEFVGGHPGADCEGHARRAERI